MSVGKLIDELADVFGESRADDMDPQTFLDTGFPPLNRAISGNYRDGMPCGRIIEMFGPPSCGKTAIATSVMANAINEDGFAIFMDHERSFEIDLARSLGLDDASGRFVRLKPETLEESFTRAINAARKVREGKMIPEKAPIVVVYDSLAAMVPSSKAAKELDELSMADSLALAKATSTTLPVLAMFNDKFNMTTLLLNQVREAPGVTHGDPTRTPGGKAPAFYASLRIRLSAAKLKADKGEKEIIGQRVTATCIKNKLNRPFAQAEWNFVFQEDGKGHFDVVSGVVDHLVEIGVLELKGARLLWDGKNLYKSQVPDYIRENEQESLLMSMLPS